MADPRQHVGPPGQRHRPTRTDDARAAALEVLGRLDTSDATLDRLLDDAAPLLNGLSRRDRALFNQLVYGVLRWRLRLDTVIGAYASRPVKKISPAVRNILRLGLFQIQFMDRIPATAAVHTAVELAKSGRASKASGFINAVLRTVLREPDRGWLPDADANPVGHMAAAHAMPPWLAARWIDRLGPEEAVRLCTAVNTIPPITLRCNELRSSPPELMAALQPHAERIEPLASVPGALNLIGPQCAIHRMPAFMEGCFAVQDAAAQLVSLLLDPRPGERVLDACAGLGGKSTHIAQLMTNRGHVLAVDHAAAKLGRLEKEAYRLGATIVESQRMDLNRPIEAQHLPLFDRILLDAPCSGLGVLRRNPDAKWSFGKQAIAGYARRQIRFLDHLAPRLKPNGVIVFAVCSMEPEENEQVIARFLKKHSNFAIVPPQSRKERSVQPFVGADGFLRTAPHIHHMDGFFAARLVRQR